MGLWDWLMSALGVGEAASSSAPNLAPSSAPTPASSNIRVKSAQGEASPVATALAPEDEPWWAPADAASPDASPPARLDLSPEARALENLLVSYFDGHDLSLPAMPQGPDQVMRALRRNDGDLIEAAHVIGEDQVLTAAVLRTVNSPFYRGEREITAVRAAVTRLGTRALRTLMMHQALQTATFQSKGADPARANMLWERARAGAWIMQELARFTGLDEEEAFLIGLLHDIGNVVVLRIVAGERVKTKARITDEEFEHLCRACHQEFGELIAASWKLPQRLQALIRDHHTAPEPNEPLAPHRWTLMLCDDILSLLRLAPGPTCNLLSSAPVAALELARRADFIEFLRGLPEFLDDALSAM